MGGRWWLVGTLEPTSGATPSCTGNVCTLCAGLTATYTYQPGLCAWDSVFFGETYTEGAMFALTFDQFNGLVNVTCNADGNVSTQHTNGEEVETISDVSVIFCADEIRD